MTNEDFQIGKHVVKIPIEVIEKIVRDAYDGPVAEERDAQVNVCDALQRLSMKWSVIYSGSSGKLYTAGFMEYDDCSEFVAKQYGTDTNIEYVMREGTPRKNVKVQVKARL